MKQILTIAIPTFNRPGQIQTQVRLLLPQLNEGVCLVVYDNCSQNPVKELFTEKELSQFSIIRNRMNVGGDANIARCFENCSTPWLWTLSDDDYAKSNAVEIVLTEINNNFEAVFLCFWSDRYFKTIGFEELAYEFRSTRVFTISFAMSFCTYNMSKLQNSLQDYYVNLSSMVGTIVLVLKYVQRNSQAVCIFTDKIPISTYDSEVGWNYAVFICRSRLFIEAFDGENNRQYNQTLFLGYHKTNYSLVLLNRNGSKLSYRRRWRAYRQIIQNQGFFNALRYTPKHMIYVFLYLIMQHKWLQLIVIVKRKIFGQKINQSSERIRKA